MSRATASKVLMFIGSATFAASSVNAQSVVDLVLENQVFDAAVDGLISEFRCELSHERVESITRVYESVERESDSTSRKVVLARIACAGVDVELTFSWREGEDPAFNPLVGNFVRAEVGPSDRSGFVSYRADVESRPVVLDTLANNAMASEISEALTETSEGRCGPVRWTISETDGVAVRDASGISSQPVRGWLGCGRLVAGCSTSYSFFGSYYPSKAFFFLERTEAEVTCV